jgi:hypothetical protein
VWITNRGRCTITQVDVRFSPNGKSTESPRTTGSNRLTPWDERTSFVSDPIGERHIFHPYPIVRWVDRWGTRWEHKRGKVRQVADGEPPF